MFKLQRLEITGFKSFADYTEVIFTGDGITAVVGPNGCGKSNVSDAISWVLGEQRAKQLRGEEMKDVIFQGTSRRQPGGMAEVVLHMIREEAPFGADELDEIESGLAEFDEHAVDLETIEVSDNNSHYADNGFSSEPENGFHPSESAVESAEFASAVAAPAAKAKTKRHWRPRNRSFDFAVGESVAVTRRLYRSGESEYLLNGKACRLRDIQDLFAGTGLSGAHYALIEQGRIGQILSAKPSDRRTLIEEAAGISKFRTRQRAAETRLETAKTNLRRISDIVSEVDKQANSLRRQAAKTRRYKILREELRALLRLVFAAEGQYLTGLAADLKTQLEKSVQRERRLFWEVAEKDEAFRLATREAREAEENLTELRARHSENALERDRASREIVYKQEQIANLQNRRAILEGETANAAQRLELLDAEAARLAEDERAQRAEAEKNELALREAERRYQSKNDELRGIEAELERNRSELLTHTTAAERFAEIARGLENTRERLVERAEGLEREAARAEQNFDEHAVEKDRLEREVGVARGETERLQGAKKSLLADLAEAKKDSQALEQALGKLRDEFSRTRHRFETLRELDAKRAVYAPTVQKLFSEQGKIGVKFLGTIADHLNVAPKAEKAVENVFGGFLQTVLVETEADARKAAKYLNENNAGRIGVLVSGQKEDQNLKVKDRKSKTENQTLLDLLGASADFAETLRIAFPRETAARVVEDFDGIESSETDFYVDFSGNMLVGGKLFVSGAAKNDQKNSSLLAFKRELRELEERGRDLNGQLENANAEVAAARDKQAGKERQINELQAQIARSERELMTREVQAKSIRQEIERADRHKKVVADERRQIEREVSEIRQKQADAKANAAKAEEARLSVSSKLAEISEKLNVARLSAETENFALNELRTLAATSQERRRSAQSALRRVETEIKDLESRLARHRTEIAESENNLNALNDSVAEIKRKTEAAESIRAGEQSELEKATMNLKLRRDEADKMSGELSALNHSSAEARNARAEVEVRQTEIVTRLQNLNENCAQELNQSLVELVEETEVQENFDLEAARRTVEELREKVEGFGAVNMLALEELGETEERLEFLTAQRQDIVDSIDLAEEALREIKQRSRDRFRQAFEAVNGYFKEFFLELFGGGRGEMTLLEAEDVLEAGIEIVAQPPGKRLQNILLLSGGEKAMTAIALVMAIFQYRPSPFCLLDEVDAPLDDANVGRFVGKIAEMSEKTQFIVITHNKRTMEAAKALYGVTMAEPGVSKVVSVKFE